MKLTITPAMAQEFLSRSPANSNYRRLDPIRVSQYAAAMKAGNWDYNGSTIKFGPNGNVVDGQHRLNAVIRSGTSIECEVVDNITKLAEIDTGKPRGFSDLLRSLGHVNCSCLSSAVRTLEMYRMHKSGDGGTRTPTSDLLRLLHQCPGMVQSVADTCHKKRSLSWLGKSCMSMLRYCTRRADSVASDRFFNELILGEGLIKGDPTYAVREYLSTAHARREKPDSITTLAIAIKGWNAFVIDRQIKNMKWKRTGENKEPFPRIVGFEEFTPEPMVSSSGVAAPQRVGQSVAPLNVLSTNAESFPWEVAGD